MTDHQLVALAAAREHAATGTGKAIRRRTRLSLKDVASNVGVDEATVSRWENGKTRPRGEPAIRWATLLNALSGARAADAA